MALEKKKFSEIPSDAIVLTTEDAIKYQTKLLLNWKVAKDVFAFKYGPYFLGCATMLTGIYMNNFFRMKFKLLHYGRISSYLPICAVPAALTLLLHQQLVLRQLVLLKQEECPICVEMRASAIQVGVGFIMPLLLAPVSSVSLAHRYNTFNMPYITKEPKKVFEIIQKQMKSVKSTLLGLFLAQALLGSVVTYLEASSIYKVNFKLTELEKKLELEGVM